MSKIDEVRADMVKAMKAKDKDTKETLSMLLAALKNKAIDKREDLTPEEETQVILKEIKQTKETLDMTPADRTEIIEECNKRLAGLEQYAPNMISLRNMLRSRWMKQRSKKSLLLFLQRWDWMLLPQRIKARS